METLLASTILVAVAEIGDKTQLLSFILAARLRRPWPIIWGILAATLANHALAGSAGAWLASLLSPAAVRWFTAAAFFAFGVWALVPDKYESAGPADGRGAFATTLVAFFIAEMGDKTQLATVALAARYDALWAVVLGTTTGLMIANVPAVLIGERLASRMRMDLVRKIAAALFFVTGVVALVRTG
ncbi:MAG TPA: TMEM165/GDT1 family protein [Burkholderiales bacterium]|nr:TMEM165/GDT1 family protein [Burkholderiales bacterium]